jgi:hypothetical protein
LIHLSPVVYNAFKTHQEAQQQLSSIAGKVKELNTLSSRPGMSVSQDDNSLAILKKSGRPYVIFSISIL